MTSRNRKYYGRIRGQDSVAPSNMLIACEKSKTESIYFGKLKSKYHSGNVVVFIGDPDPVNLISSALWKKSNLERTGIVIDELWCVFDHDNRDTRFELAVKQADENGFKVAYSIPQFELWYLLHYQEQFAHIDKAELMRRLKKHIPGYLKTKDYTEMLEPLRKTAVRNAREIRTMHERKDKPETTNPATRVDVLVEQLFELFETR